MPEGTLEVFEVAVWPLMALGAVGLFLLIFRAAIGRLIDRISKFAYPGGSADASPAPIQDTKPDAVEGKAEETAVADLSRNGVQLQEGYATAVFKRAGELVPDLADRVVHLSNMVALENRYRWFEFIYRQIFGSQIYLLDQLNSRGAIDVQEVRQTFEARRADVGLADHPYEAWILFLERMGLVAYHNGAMVLHPAGKDFLRYIVDSGYTFNLPR